MPSTRSTVGGKKQITSHGAAQGTKQNLPVASRLAGTSSSPSASKRRSPDPNYSPASPATPDKAPQATATNNNQPSEDGWRQVTKPAPARRQSDTQQTVSTHNTYAILSEGVSAVRVNDCPTTNTATQKLPPPIIVGSTNYNTLTLSNDLRAEGFSAFGVRGIPNGIKISAHNAETHKQIVAFLRSNGLPFHTYAPRGTRPNKQWLLLGFDKDHPIESIREAIEVVSGVLDVRRMQKTLPDGSRYNIAPVVVTTNPTTRITELQQVHHIDNVLFKIVEYTRRQGIPQCHRCQRFGHTKNNCGYDAVCVRCSGGHEARQCDPATNKLCCAVWRRTCRLIPRMPSQG